MIVADLLDLLKKYPLTHKVILSSDSEGNYYSPLSDIDEVCYAPSNSWSGEIDDDQDVNAIVLVPTN